MKTEVVEKVLNRMADKLDPEQLQELKSALVISLEGYQVTREETQLSTEVYDNWDYAKKFFQALIVAGKAKGTIETYSMHIRILLDDIRKPIIEITDEDLMLHLARQKYSRNLSNRYLNYKRLVFRNTYRRTRQNCWIRLSMM